MKAKMIRKKAPRVWDSVRDGVMEDLRLQKKIHKFDITVKTAQTIAHNAAYFATLNILGIHEALKKEVVHYKKMPKDGNERKLGLILGLIEARMIIDKETEAK